MEQLSQREGKENGGKGSEARGGELMMERGSDGWRERVMDGEMDGWMDRTDGRI